MYNAYIDLLEKAYEYDVAVSRVRAKKQNIRHRLRNSAYKIDRHFVKRYRLSKAVSEGKKMTNIKYFILTGEPGVGKTTLTKKLNSILRSKGVHTAGFYTEEVRQQRTREGFDIVTLDGQKGRLARDASLLNGPTKFKVGKYGVLVEEFENVALPSLTKPVGTEPCLLIIDEIGKMEFYSDSFKARIREIFSPNSNNMVLATIPVRKSDTLIENIRKNIHSKVWMVTKENRNTIHEDILKELQAASLKT